MRRPDINPTPQNIYIESVSVPVHMGSTSGKHEAMTEMVAVAEGRGWRLEQLASVYAEKLGVNSVIHTMFFRAVTAN